MDERMIRKGKQIYFEIALDEEQILKDGIYNLKAIYEYMDEAFAAHDCVLAKIDGVIRYYTRNKDNKDLACLFLGSGIFDESRWFEKYVCHYWIYVYDEGEEDWIEESDLSLRRNFRDCAIDILKLIKDKYDGKPQVKLIRRLLWQTSYQCIEEEDFLLFHKKDFSDYKEGMRLMSVNLEKKGIAGIVALLVLMQMDKFPDSVIVAFLKNTNEKNIGIQKLVRLLKKAKKTYRAIVLDVTNTGWEEECVYTLENCYLTKRMYSDLRWALDKSQTWKIVSQERQILKEVMYMEENISSNAPRGKECDYYNACGVNCFSYCLPVKEDVEKSEKIVIDMHRLGWYMYNLIELGKRRL